jgi:hypothetical protein
MPWYSLGFVCEHRPLMIEDSDDNAATSLWSEVGGAPAISRYDDLAGLGATVPNTEGYWGETTTTPLEAREQLGIVSYDGKQLPSEHFARRLPDRPLANRRIPTFRRRRAPHFGGGASRRAPRRSFLSFSIGVETEGRWPWLPQRPSGLGNE